MAGLSDHNIETVKLKDLSIQYVGGGKKEWVNRDIPEKRKGNPEYYMFGSLPTYGFYCLNEKNI